MKKFITKLLIFSTPIVVCGIVAEVLLRHIPNDYKYKRNYIDNYSKDLEILFLGSSHAYYGISPKYMTRESFNAAYVSQSLDYDLEIFNRFIKNSRRLKFVVVPISYFSLFSKLSSGVESWRSKDYNMYYDIDLTSKLTDNSEVLGGKNTVNLRKLYKFYIHGKSVISCDSLGWGNDFNSKIKNSLVSTGESAAKRHTNLNVTILQENLSVLEKLIVSAKNKNVKVLFYTPPAFKTYISNLEHKQLKLTISSVQKLDDENKNVNYLNLLNDPSFLREDYYDADHLNDIGAKKLSQKMDSITR